MKQQQYYGQIPENLGIVNLQVDEIMNYQYMPIKMAKQYTATLEYRLHPFERLITSVQKDLGPDKWVESYIYITAKHGYVNGTNSLNRPGWHSDGFLSDDINYIWCDAEPTEFAELAQGFTLTLDHEISLKEMEEQASKYAYIQKLPVKTLARLDQFVIHRAPVNCRPGFRTFVKISVSKEKYNLVGNTHNYLLDYKWDMQPREETRNHPVK